MSIQGIGRANQQQDNSKVLLSNILGEIKEKCEIPIAAGSGPNLQSVQSHEKFDPYDLDKYIKQAMVILNPATPQYHNLQNIQRVIEGSTGHQLSNPATETNFEAIEGLPWK